MEEEGVQETEPTPNARLKGPSAGGDPDDLPTPATLLQAERGARLAQLFNDFDFPHSKCFQIFSEFSYSFEQRGGVFSPSGGV